MFGKKKSQVPDESQRRGLDLSEMVGLFFSFLWFHRGVVLFALVLWGLYSVLMKAHDKVAETKRRDAVRPAFVYVPRPEVDKPPMETRPAADTRPLREYILPPSDREPSDVSPSDGQPSNTQPSSAQPPNPQPVVRKPKKKPAKRPEDPKTIRFRKFLTTASFDSLSRRYTILMQTVTSVNALEAVGNIKKCQQICECIRDKELNPEQEELRASMELETASQFDAVNTQHEMGIPGLRDRLMVTATRLYAHPSVDVSAKAHLAIFAAHAMDLIFDPKREELAALIKIYETHIDGAMRQNETAVVMADLLQQIIQRHQFDEVIALRRDMANRMLESDSLDFDELGQGLKERLIFGDLGLGSLISRVDGESQAASEDVELFCQRLDRFPDTRKEVYQVALAVIDKYVASEQFDQASGLLRTLQEIKRKIPNPKTKDWLGKNILEHAEKISLAQTAQ